MNIWRRTAVITLVAMALPILALAQEKPGQPQGNSMQVVRDVLATDVVNREPVDDTSVFPASVGAIYYFTEVQGVTTPTQITHIWYYKGEKMAEVLLAVESARWRTWSSKRILQSWIGPWRVEAMDPDGNLLSSKTFDVQ